MTTRQKILAVLLVAGALVGFGSEFAHLRECARHRRASFHQQVAHTCAEAALAVRAAGDGSGTSDGNGISTSDGNGNGNGNVISNGNGNGSTLVREP